MAMQTSKSRGDAGRRTIVYLDDAQTALLVQADGLYQQIEAALKRELPGADLVVVIDANGRERARAGLLQYLTERG